MTSYLEIHEDEKCPKCGSCTSIESSKLQIKTHYRTTMTCMGYDYRPAINVVGITCKDCNIFFLYQD